MPDSTAVIQVAFEVPQEIATGLSTGELVRYGGVVRDTGGRVVKHLDEITPKPSDDAANAIQQAASNAMNFVKKNKKGTIIVLAVAAIGGIAYKTVKGSQKKALEKLQVEASERFNASLTAYIKALENENLTLTDIEGLQRAIADFEDVAGDGGLTIEMPGGQFSALVQAVAKYTQALARANDHESNKTAALITDDCPASLQILNNCLSIQRDIFDEAA